MTPFFKRNITQGTNQKICIYFLLSRYVLKSLLALLSFENQIRQVTLLDLHTLRKPLSGVRH